VLGKRLSTLSIRLGLFAMLMIHVGPLYSALQLAHAAAAPASEQHHQQHAGHDQASAAHAHHRTASDNAPDWLAALELCGYCELLTLSPPLTLSLELILPRHEPERFLALPAAPLLPIWRRSAGYARAPPAPFHC